MVEKIQTEGARWEVDPESPVVPCKLHLFGVNELTTQEVMRLFEPVGGAVKLEWLDDYSCNVVLKSDEQLLDIFDSYPGADDPHWRKTDPIPREENPSQLVVLDLRRATEADKKHIARKWQHSEFYRKRLETQKIVIVPAENSDKPAIILKPAVKGMGIDLRPAPGKVVLEPRRREERSRSRRRDEEYDRSDDYRRVRDRSRRRGRD